MLTYRRGPLVGVHEEAEDLGPLADFLLCRKQVIDVVALLFTSIDLMLELDGGVPDPVALHDIADSAQLFVRLRHVAGWVSEHMGGHRQVAR